MTTNASTPVLNSIATVRAGGSELTLSSSGEIRFLHRDGHLWQSQGPLFHLHYYDRQHPRKQSVAVPSGDSYSFGTAGTTSLSCVAQSEFITRDERTIVVRTVFKGIETRIDVEFAIDPSGERFFVRVHDRDIHEDHPKLYRILSLEILPQFGAAASGEAGYLTLPNWSGCQTFFDKSYPREVRETVYSSNDRWEHVCNMPVFGITRAQGTLCGLITQGDFDAQLVARVHWEKEHANSVHPELVYRWEQQDERLAGPREIRYSFAPPHYAGGEGYVFCGTECRNFLRAERGLLSWDEKAKTRPVVLDYRDRFFVKVFMAYKDPEADGHGPYHSCTTFAETREILEDCLRRGMRKLAVMVVGWGQDGHDGMPPTRFPVDERLGGEKGMRELIAWCGQNDIMLGVHDSYGGSYRCSPEFDLDDVLRHRTGEPWETIIWSGGQAHNLCPNVYLDKHVRRDIPDIRALGIHGHHHIDAVGSFMTCYSPKHPLEKRADYVAKVREMFKFASEQIGSVSTEMPFGPYFDVVDGVYHSYTKPSPWHRASPVGQHFLDRSIPLIQIVLHGSINCCEALDTFREDSALRWLGMALSPQTEFCVRASDSFGISAYSTVADRIERLYKLYYEGDEILRRTNPGWIDGFWEVAKGVSRIRYSNGIELQVNASSETHDGIPANSYRMAKN